MKIDFRELTWLPSAMMRGAGFVLVFAVIWIPWFAYNHVPEAQIKPAMIEQARHSPDDNLLDELSRYDLGVTLSWAEDRQLIAAAEKLLQGRIELPGFQAKTFALPFNTESMASGSTIWQLFIHGLGLPRLLLDAYKVDGRPEFLRTAADYLLAYDAYEGSGWGPNGFLWNDKWQRFVRNDHAISARVVVLADFWRLYRHNQDYRPDVAEAVFRMAARCSYLLTAPSRFTFATNHGVMQNLAACHLRLSFPTLPGIEGHCRLAFKRLDEQFSYFVNDEGFILEHSPGYQGFGLRLIGIAFRYRTLLGLEIPDSWLRKYQAAQRVYATLRRPNGSLPVFGDTDGGSNGEEPSVVPIDDQGRAGRPAVRTWSPKELTLLAPVAGYSLWWSGLDAWPDSRHLSQTMVAWSYFPGMGHKHADEMSLAVWARGTSWWTNVGYWSYDDPARDMAESWDGSNAPHLIGEPADSPRQTRLLYHGREDDLAAIDLERQGPGPYRTRRQVIHVGSGIWVVLDTSSGVEGENTRTIWTTSPGVQLVEAGARGAYNLTDRNSGQSLRAFFDGAPGTLRRTVEGSRTPFGGWSVTEWQIQPAPAVIVERPADGSWTLAAWLLVDEPEFEPQLGTAARMHRWTGAEDWEVVLPTSAGPVTLQRRQEQINISPTPDGHVWSLKLEPGLDVTQAKADLHNALAVIAEQYGAADMSGKYRGKVTMVLLAALVLNIIVLRVVRRYWPSWKAPLGLILSGGWLLMSYYFIFVRAHLV